MRFGKCFGIPRKGEIRRAEAVNKVLLDELSKAKKILSDNRAALDKIVEVLLKENHLSSNMIDEIFSQNAKRTES